MDEISKQYGDNPQHFNQLIYYHKHTPLDYLKDISLYEEDFPSSHTMLNQAVIHDACEFEMSDHKLRANIQELPIWLESRHDKRELFAQFRSKIS